MTTITADMRPADLLREAAARGQYGHSRHPSNFYLPDPDGVGAAYWAGQTTWFFRDLPDEVTLKVLRLSRRYRRLCRLAREVWPQWTEVDGGRIHWADNAIDITEVDRHGRTRTRQIVAPHGDTC